MNHKKALLVKPFHTLALLLATAATTKAQITFVDAIHGASGNTFETGSTLGNTAWLSTANNSTVNNTQWVTRSPWGNGDTVYQSNISSTAGFPEITTQITGLANGTYDIWGFFWDNITGSGEKWIFSAGLNSGALSTYSNDVVTGAITTGVVNTSTLSFSNNPTIAQTVSSVTYNMFGVKLGQVVVSGGMVHVYVDRNVLGNSTQNRVWYDGVGYELVPQVETQVTYIDADNTPGTGNTVLDGSGSFGPGSTTTADADGLWSVRTRPSVNGGGILHTNEAEDATPRLATTVTLPGPGLYTIYGYFWNNLSGSGVWDAGFKLGPVRPAVVHTKANAANLSSTSGHFTSPTIAVDDGAGQVLSEAVLGTWNTAKEGLSVTLYVDDPETGGESGNTEDRTWYDGLGYIASSIVLTPGVDSDNDGLSNLDEVNTHGTDPTLADTDGDSYNDGTEIANATNPLLPDAPPLPPGVPADAILIQNDGAWTWFNDHTARFVNGDLYIGYVKGQAQKMALTRYDFDTTTAHEFLFGTATNPSNDDHDVPSVTVLPDGKVLSVYSRHNLDTKFFYRLSLNGNPSSLADWGAEQTKTLGTSKNTYSNTFRLSSESDKIYNFSRNINFNPTLHTSTDNGQTWSDPVHFIRTGTGGTRPYPRYATNHFDRIDLIYTDGHPRDVNNSIYHLFFQGGNFLKSDGTAVKNIANLPLEHSTGERGTVVYPYTTTAWGVGQGPDDWIPNGRAWTWDIQYQADGKPVCVFQVQADGAAGPATDFKNDRIYYYYARWNGSQWIRKFIAHAGHGLFSTEDDYGGGISIDPENPNIIYLSSNAANPFDLATLAPALNPNNGIYEIYRGVTSDGGASWAWEAITSNSNASNMRPFVPEDHGRNEAVVWFRGRYTTFLNYDCDIYGIFSEPTATGLHMRNVQWQPGGASFKWSSIPGKSYRIAASTDLQSFPIDAATGISAQGDTTYHPFAFPPAMSGSPKAFFRVEEE
jgi:BNR repeat-containing family member/Bacterial TSP3 repeat